VITSNDDTLTVQDLALGRKQTTELRKETVIIRDILSDRIESEAVAGVRAARRERRR